MGDTRLDQLIKMWGYCDKMGESESEQLIGLLLAERDSLQSQLSEARAHCERLRSACQLGIDMMAANDLDLPKTVETMRDAMQETPEQSLAEIKAQAIEEAIDNCAWHNDRTWMKIDDIKEYAASLRQQGKG